MMFVLMCAGTLCFLGAGDDFNAHRLASGWANVVVLVVCIAAATVIHVNEGRRR